MITPNKIGLFSDDPEKLFLDVVEVNKSPLIRYVRLNTGTISHHLKTKMKVFE